MRAALDPNALDRSMVRAVAWNAMSKWITQLLSWVSIVVVARLLSPSDFGLVGMAAVYINLAGLIAQCGLGVTVLTIRDLTRRQIAEMNTIALLMGVGLFAISCAVAPPIAKFFAVPQLTSVVIAWSSLHVINALQVIPNALLQKELRFKLLASLESVRTLIQVAVTVVLAWRGLGYWSLVYGHILSCAVATALTLCWRRHKFELPTFNNLGREIRFSGRVSVFDLAWYVYSNADFLIAGRMLGKAPLGDYTVAWNISSAPIEKIGNLVTNVTPAFFAAVQHDLAELRRYVLRLTEVLSYVTVPASVGIALLADLIVPVVLGPKWIGVIGPLRLLGIFVAFRSLNTILPKVLTSIGDTSFVMWTTLAAAVIMPASFFVGSKWGTNGIAAAWVVMYPVITIPVYWRMFHRIGMTPSEYISIVLPAVNASLLMTAAVLFSRWMTSTLSSPVRLAILVVVGALTYGAALLVFYRQRVKRLVRAVQELRKSKPPVAADPVPFVEPAKGL
jgi:PST family polysaccharide transporter